MLSGSVPAEKLAGGRLLHNARFLLEAAAREPITATKTLGNLNRRFVGAALDGMRWPDGYVEDVRYINKVVDEEDVRKLNLLRVALVNGGMLRRYRGAFVTTKRGRYLAQPRREGALLLGLWIAYFVETNLAYTDRMPEDPLVQSSARFIMHAVLAAGEQWITLDESRQYVLVSEGIWDGEEYYPGGKRDSIDLAVRVRILEPLEDLGLIEVDATRERFLRQVKAFRGTPLLRAFASVAPERESQLNAPVWLELN